MCTNIVHMCVPYNHGFDFKDKWELPHLHFVSLFGFLRLFSPLIPTGSLSENEIHINVVCNIRRKYDCNSNNFFYCV